MELSQVPRVVNEDAIFGVGVPLHHEMCLLGPLRSADVFDCQDKPTAWHVRVLRDILVANYFVNARLHKTCQLFDFCGVEHVNVATLISWVL